MTFSSITFVIFFAIVCSVVFLIDRNFCTKRFSNKVLLYAKHFVLLFLSYIFYGWWDYRFCFLMVLLTIISWFCAKQIDTGKPKKLYICIGVIVPLVVLGYFKYFNFFISSFTDIFGIANPGSLNIILPVGISFFTFQSMSYTIDVYKGTIKSYSFLDVALYISFFPQLVAGPIVKASEFMPQLKENRKLKLSDFNDGIQIFSIGLFKKLVIADNLSVFVDDVFAKPGAFSSATIVLSVISYSIQIYCDFSGYSDMAIGTAKCLGYSFSPNFNIPYISKNLTELWKRWHISLSSWLQEYLYFSLGGNRKGKFRTYINLLLTMVLGGFWHGASYNFIIWGILHGLGLCVHKLYRQLTPRKKSTVIGSVLSVVFTYLYVNICWVFFRAENFSSAITILKRIFIPSQGITQIFSWSLFSIVVLVLCHVVAYVWSKKKNRSRIEGFYPIMDLSKFSSLVILFAFLGLTLMLAYTNANPFIYFQF